MPICIHPEDRSITIDSLINIFIRKECDTANSWEDNIASTFMPSQAFSRSQDEQSQLPTYVSRSLKGYTSHTDQQYFCP